MKIFEITESNLNLESDNECESNSVSLDVENNEYLSKISTQEHDMISALNNLLLSSLDMNKMMLQLTNYLYVDNVNTLMCGCHIRWIDLNNPNKITLNRGAMFCNINTLGTALVCKTYTHRHIHVNFNECFVFQKINTQYQDMFDFLTLNT